MTWMESKVVTERTQADTLNDILNILFYENREHKPITHSTLKYIYASRTALGEANALLIDGIIQFDLIDKPYKLFSEAEAKGCTHPMLYYYIAHCHKCFSDVGTPKDPEKAFEYFIKATNGKSTSIN